MMRYFFFTTCLWLGTHMGLAQQISIGFGCGSGKSYIEEDIEDHNMKFGLPIAIYTDVAYQPMYSLWAIKFRIQHINTAIQYVDNEVGGVCVYVEPLPTGGVQKKWTEKYSKGFLYRLRENNRRFCSPVWFQSSREKIYELCAGGLCSTPIIEVLESSSRNYALLVRPYQYGTRIDRPSKIRISWRRSQHHYASRLSVPTT